MATKPTEVPEWAVNNVVDPVSGQNNVLEPPPEKKLEGWARLEFPPRNWFNWLARLAYQWIEWFKQQEEQAVVTDGNGAGLFVTDTALITLYAVDKNTPANYIFAIGYKGVGNAPALTVVNNNVLTLGAGNIAGDQPISGGSAANIIVWGQTKVIP